MLSSAAAVVKYPGAGDSLSPRKRVQIWAGAAHGRCRGHIFKGKLMLAAALDAEISRHCDDKNFVVIQA